MQSLLLLATQFTVGCHSLLQSYFVQAIKRLKYNKETGIKEKGVRLMVVNLTPFCCAVVMSQPLCRHLGAWDITNCHTPFLND